MKSLFNWSEISRIITGSRNRILKHKEFCFKKRPELLKFIGELRQDEENLRKKIENFLHK